MCCPFAQHVVPSPDIQLPYEGHTAELTVADHQHRRALRYLAMDSDKEGTLLETAAVPFAVALQVQARDKAWRRKARLTDIA